MGWPDCREIFKERGRWQYTATIKVESSEVRTCPKLKETIQNGYVWH